MHAVYIKHLTYTKAKHTLVGEASELERHMGVPRGHLPNKIQVRGQTTWVTYDYRPDRVVLDRSHEDVIASVYLPRGSGYPELHVLND